MSIMPEGIHNDELKRTAAFFFVLNFNVIMISYALYNEGMPWGLATLAISGATSIAFALSATFSIFGAVKRSKVSLVVGFLGMATALVLAVVMIMQFVSDQSN